jgi:hypothetical protein
VKRAETLAWGAGVGAVLLVGGLALALSSERTPAPQPAPAPAPAPAPKPAPAPAPPAPAPTALQAEARALAAKYFRRDGNGCAFAWVRATSVLEMALEMGFMRRAADELTASSVTVASQSHDARTEAVYGLLTDGCTKPVLLQPFDLDQAAAGELPTMMEPAWKFAMKSPTAQLYMAVRAMVGVG